MSATGEATQSDQELIESLVQRIGADLGMIIDRSVDVHDCSVERLDHRVAGEDLIHISFRLGLRVNGLTKQGCVLLPLPEAISVAGYLMMLSEDEVAEYRGRDTLDVPMKEAMLEVGNFIAGACDAVLRRCLPSGSSIRSEGCQGVRPDVQPAFEYDEGEGLVVGRARASIDEFPEFELIVMLPDSCS